MDIIMAPLLLSSCPGTKGGNVEGRGIIDISTAHLIAREPDRVTKPLPSHPDRHLQTESELGMKKWRGVFVISEILDELGVLVRELINVLTQRHTGSIHDCQIIAEDLQKLNLAILEHMYLSWLILRPI
jgi:hypothetical protein